MPLAVLVFIKVKGGKFYLFAVFEGFLELMNRTAFFPLVITRIIIRDMFR